MNIARDFLERRGIRWGGRIAKPQTLTGHRRGNTNWRVHQIHRPRAAVIQVRPR